MLEQFGLDRDKDIVIFNGSSGDAESRAKLVNEFKTSKKVFLTTEAGAEGLNLQFCNLLINYDLPWNPQRIEQRIGRCHRYGQTLDVVVINFVNDKNVADRRVLELLSEKFNLFDGAFGASDEVLGQIESGVDIERKIFDLYLRCRDEQTIRAEFDKLLEENREQIDNKMSEAKRALLESFDEEVQRKLRTRQNRMLELMDAQQTLVQNLVLSSLAENTFEYDGGRLILQGPNTSKSEYTFHKTSQDAVELIHARHPMVVSSIQGLGASFEVTFHYTGKHNISALRDLIGASGAFALYRIEIAGLEIQDFIVPVFVVNTSNGHRVISEAEITDKLLTVTCTSVPTEDSSALKAMLELALDSAKAVAEGKLKASTQSNQELYQEELEKIERYYEDIRNQKRLDVEDVENKISQLKKDRSRVGFDEQRMMNSEIQKLKDKVARLEDEISALRAKCRDAEKKRLSELEDQLNISTTTTLIASGPFSVI